VGAGFFLPGAFASVMPEPASQPESSPGVIAKLRLLLERCLKSDRRAIAHRLDELERKSAKLGPVPSHVIEPVLERIKASVKARQDRAMSVPIISYPEELPISQRRVEISAAIAKHQVVVVCGETGSGKSTQLPKICLELGRGVDGLIGHTQPRRIAARGVASRVAEELGVEMGTKLSPVGFKVRFGDQTGPGTMVKLMTDGILLAETQGDRLLEAYDTIIIDEAHERSLNIDFLLGYLRQLLPKRPDLKVIITSATIDPERLSKHFFDAPIINVSGRTYPVEVIYRPYQAADIDEAEDRFEHSIVTAVAELTSYGPGDVLVFLPGEREIRETAELLAGAGWGRTKGTELVPLYARLSTSEQMRVFQPHNGTRVVLATNVAETSVTVPGIMYVVDTGMARISRYSPRTKVQRLPIEPISQASADQRKGRCGRLGPGICIRLYDELEFAKREKFTEPEVLRTNLASVILQMKALKLGDPRQFPFVDPPDNRLIQDGYDTLVELGAIDELGPEGGELTKIGREMAKLPVDPRIARIVLAGRDEACLREAIIIASALAVQDPRERPLDKQVLADAAHERFRDKESDFLLFIKLWQFWRKQSQNLGTGKLRRLCRENFLSFVRMREWEEVHDQLRDMARELGAKEHDKPASYEQVHRAILTGMLSNIGEKGEQYEYKGARDNKFFLFPGSGVFSEKPKWVVSAELVRTTKLYARTNAKIDPAWAEHLGKHLLKRSYSDPHWDQRSGRVLAYEKVTLFGLELAAKRRTHYGPIDPVASREIFMRHALVLGEMNARGEWSDHNRELIDRVKRMEAKLRRSDLLLGDDARAAFFEDKIPKDVYAVQAFERWRHDAEKANPQLLFMSLRDVLNSGVPGIDKLLALFPDHLDFGEPGRPLELHLIYKAEPGADDDGITAIVPLEVLTQVQPARGQWLVPGMLAEKVEELIRNLPKQLRTTFVPAGQVAEEAIEIMRSKFAHDTLAAALSKVLLQIGDVQIPPSLLDEAKLPRHLLINYRVVDAHGQMMVQSRDPVELRRELASTLTQNLAKMADPVHNRAKVTRWDFGDIESQVEVDPGQVATSSGGPAGNQPKALRSGGLKVVAFPALVDEVTHAALRLMPTRAAALDAHARGVLRLITLEQRTQLEACVRAMPSFQELSLLYSTAGSPVDIKRLLIDRTAEIAFLGELDAAKDLRLEAEFRAALMVGEDKVDAAAKEVAGVMVRTLRQAQQTLLIIERTKNPALGEAIADVRDQLDHLLVPDYLRITPWRWLSEYPRFLRAIEVRLSKLSGPGMAKDMRAMQEIEPRWQAYKQYKAHHERRSLTGSDPELALYRWMIEELRVSLFAQDLGTSVPVSSQRLDKQWSRIEAV
jgi:ATP-dependent helicase HrpA